MSRFADTHAATAICGGIGMNHDLEDQFLEGIDGNLTAEQVAALMELGDGDTGAQSSDEGGEPGASTDAANEDTTDAGNTDQTSAMAEAGADAAAQESAKPTEAELNAENAVILAKDGKHTISYDKLLEAREGEKNARALLAEQSQELATLRAQAQQRADAGLAPTAKDNLSAAAEAAIEQGADKDLFGDFSEEALAKGIQTLVSRQVAEQVAAQVSTQVAQKLAPIEQKHAQDATSAHTNAIYEKHPDADSVYESQEFANWVNSQPSYARAAIAGVLDPKTGGTAEQVVEIFDRFKQETGAPQAPAANTSVKAAAKAAVASAQAAPPASLSDIPGGRAGAHSRAEAMAGMDGVALIDSMDNMSAEQIEQYLNSI